MIINFILTFLYRQFIKSLNKQCDKLKSNCYKTNELIIKPLLKNKTDLLVDNCLKINESIINKEYTPVLFDKPTNGKCDWNFFNSPFFQYFKIGCSN